MDLHASHLNDDDAKKIPEIKPEDVTGAIEDSIPNVDASKQEDSPEKQADEKEGGTSDSSSESESEQEKEPDDETQDLRKEEENKVAEDDEKPQEEDSPNREDKIEEDEDEEDKAQDSAEQENDQDSETEEQTPESDEKTEDSEGNDDAKNLEDDSGKDDLQPLPTEEEKEEETKPVENDKDQPPVLPSDTEVEAPQDDAKVPEQEDDGKNSTQEEPEETEKETPPADKDSDEVPPADKDNQLDDLHGNNDKYDSGSSSSSSSDDEDAGPLVIRGTPDSETHEDPDDLAQCLKRALQEREKQQQEAPPQPPLQDDYVEPEDFDEGSLGARKPEEFAAEPQAVPALPPKMKQKSLTGPKDPIPNILRVNDKTASLGRGRWSDDEQVTPSAHKQRPMYPTYHAPDRVIDFSQPPLPRKQKRRRSPNENRDKQQHFDPPTRIITIPKRPEGDINELYKRQAMVSLHSNVPGHQDHEDSDQYDSVNEDLGDLNQLIKEANSLNIYEDKKSDPIDVIYPSYQRNTQKKKNLESALPDVFAKLAVNQDDMMPIRPIEETVQFSAIPQGPDLPIKTSRLPPRNKRKSLPGDQLPMTRDPLDGDDEISIDESDFKFPSIPNDISKSLTTNQYFSEVYPSDYTDFESETDATEVHHQNYLHADLTPYDTVADQTDFDMPKPKDNDNHIVNDQYQICTTMDRNNHHTFPRRIKQDKPVPKERASLNTMAIALTDPNSGPNRRFASMPFQDPSAPLKRNKSEPDMVELAEPAPGASLFGQVPHLVVTRGPTDGAAPLNPERKKSKKSRKSESDDAPTQFHLSVSNSDTDATVVGNPGNLKINLLPSDDPNVINLNITTGGSSPQIVTPQPKEKDLFDAEPIFSPLQIQPIMPMTAVAYPPPASPDQDIDTNPQHRVVDMPSLMVDTSDVLAQPAEPEERHTPLTPEVIISQPMIPPMQLIQPVMSHQIEAMPPTQQIVTTNRTMVAPQATTLPAEQPTSHVVEIQSPWDGRNRSLPAQYDKSLRHGGDSGIDLTNYEAGRQNAIQESDSDSDSDYDMKSTNSKRKLKHADELNKGGLSDKYIEWYESQYMNPSCCYLFLKHLMFFLNLIFFLVGLGLLGLGLWGIIDMVIAGVNDINTVVSDPVFPLLVLGFILTLVCFTGAIGFLRDNVCLLKFFAICLITLSLVFVAGGITFWVMQATATQFITQSFANLVPQYNSTTRKSASFTLDKIQSTFECCGFISDKDWTNSTAFPCPGGKECDLPPTCCKEQASITCQTIAGSKYPFNCIDAMSLWARNRTEIIVGAWMAVFILFVINFVCVYFMMREIKYLHSVRDKIFSLGDDESEVEVEVIYNHNVKPDYDAPFQYAPQ